MNSEYSPEWIQIRDDPRPQNGCFLENVQMTSDPPSLVLEFFIALVHKYASIYVNL